MSQLVLLGHICPIDWGGQGPSQFPSSPWSTVENEGVAQKEGVAKPRGQAGIGAGETFSHGIQDPAPLPSDPVACLLWLPFCAGHIT